MFTLDGGYSSARPLRRRGSFRHGPRRARFGGGDERRYSEGQDGRDQRGTRGDGGHFRHNRPHFHGGPRRFGNRQGRKPQSFDPTLLIRKAEPQTEEVFVPKHVFDDFAIDAQLKRNIADRGYQQPTMIQDQAIPELLEGKDVVGLANTGTGKTAAFLIPLIQKCIVDPTQRVLIVVPTRELAVQIEQELTVFTRGLHITTAMCIGGVNIRPQIHRLHRRPHFVVGTPGRLRDLEEQRALHFDVFHTIVLDEVDQMLDMGFIRDIQHIANRLPTERQSLFFSATLSDKISSVMRGFLKDPVRISVKTRETAASVDQDVVHTAGKEKIVVLDELLRKPGFDKVLVFVRTKHGAEKLNKALHQRGVQVEAIHGNRSQFQRQRAIDVFKRDRVQVLIATDVASRGLDIDDVTHVVNYDLPETYEAYVHRIGRTGRANKKGIALSFVE